MPWLSIATGACWGVFIATWAIGALYNARFAPRTVGLGSKLGLSPGPGQRWILAGVGVFLLLQAFVPRSVWVAVTFRSDALALTGEVILIASTVFTLWARWTLGKMWSIVPTLREHHELRTDGPYQLTRHPIYTGILGMLLGSVLVAGFGGVLVALVVFGGVFLQRIPREERLMLDARGA